MTMSLRRARLASAIIDRYPRAWRERYADELRAMLEDSGASWRDVLDLARGALAEWRLEFLDPERHRVTSFLSYAATRYWPHLIVIAALGSAPIVAAPQLRAAFGEPPTWLPVSAFVLGIAIFLRAVREKIRFDRGRGAPASVTEMVVSSVAIVSAISVGYWAEDDPVTGLRRWIWIYNGFWVACVILNRRARTSVEEARATVAVTREQLKWARMELTRLQSIDRTSSEEQALDRQRAAVAELNAKLADAYAIIRRVTHRQNAA
jgi:hypothetical protein